jgi:formylglycine-generating enzyme required for sulfatase activity
MLAAFLRMSAWLLSLGGTAPPREPIVVEDGFGRPLFPAPAPKPARRPAPAKPSPPARCPEGMVYVPGGKFDGKRVPAFCLDRTEVRVAEFSAYLLAVEKRGEVTRTRVRALESALRTSDWSSTPTPPPDVACTWDQRGTHPELPINCVSCSEAAAYCAAQGKRLPSGREWKWAARNRGKESPYPWGSGQPSPRRVNMATDGKKPQVMPAAAYDPSLGGLHDLAGNVWEWAPDDSLATACSVRGGGFRSTEAREVKATAVLRPSSDAARSDEVGFRCAAPVQTAEARP